MERGPKRIGEALDRVIERTGLGRPGPAAAEGDRRVEVLDLMPPELAEDLGLDAAAGPSPRPTGAPDDGA